MGKRAYGIFNDKKNGCIVLLFCINIKRCRHKTLIKWFVYIPQVDIFNHLNVDYTDTLKNIYYRRLKTLAKSL